MNEEHPEQTIMSIGVAEPQHNKGVGPYGRELIELIAEFLRISPETVRDRLESEFRNPGALVAEAWRRADPASEEEIIRFYSNTDAYIFDLAADHCRARRNQVWQKIVHRIEKQPFANRFLMYGDGIGVESVELAKRGYAVTYFDLEGLTSAFARFRFHKLGVQDAINVVYDSKALPRDYYDVVVSIEVLEHLSDPVAAMAQFRDVLRPGGIALITESFGTVGPAYPSHLPSNLRFVGKTHHLMEGLGFASTYFSLDPVNYPMEFTKVGPGTIGRLRVARGFVRRAGLSRLHLFRTKVTYALR